MLPPNASAATNSSSLLGNTAVRAPAAARSSDALFPPPPPPPTHTNLISFSPPKTCPPIGEAPRRAPDLPAPGTAIKICSACHGPGHWARECPAEGRAGRGGEPWHSNTVPPDPFWACLGEYHWAHQCEKSLARRAAGQCVLCGKDDHWFKKCELYNPAIHRSKVKTPGRPGTGPQRSNATWCLRHGQTGHPTATCDISSAPILLPPEELKEKFENVCLWCNLYGHTMIQCMRRSWQSKTTPRLVS